MIIADRQMSTELWKMGDGMEHNVVNLAKKKEPKWGACWGNGGVSTDPCGAQLPGPPVTAGGEGEGCDWNQGDYLQIWTKRDDP